MIRTSIDVATLEHNTKSVKTRAIRISSRGSVVFNQKCQSGLQGPCYFRNSKRVLKALKISEKKNTLGYTRSVKRDKSNGHSLFPLT